MRYLWPVLIVLFVLFSIDFATQNPEVVVVKYSLEWLNYGIRSERPLFVTLYLTLALGILFSVLYFLVYHTKLLAQMRKLRGEIKKLQKQLEEEKDSKRQSQIQCYKQWTFRTDTVIQPLQGVFNHDNLRILGREIDAEQNKQDDQNRPEITHRKFNASDN